MCPYIYPKNERDPAGSQRFITLRYIYYIFEWFNCGNESGPAEVPLNLYVYVARTKFIVKPFNNILIINFNIKFNERIL